MSKHQESRVFGKRAEQHFLILASGERVRHMTIRPWMTGLTFAFVGLLSLGYLAATAYLVLRDDLIGATMARQARMQYEYEDRIAALRAQVDRVTSRQMLDQQVVEQKVEKLLEQQNALSSRNGKIGSILGRAAASGIAEAPAEPQQNASLGGGLKAIDALMGKAETASAETRELAYADPAPAAREGAGDRADRLFSTMTLSLKSIEQEQMDRLQSLASGAESTASKIEDIMSGTGVQINREEPSAVAEGGPFVEPLKGSDFDLSLQRLDEALDRLEAVRATATRLPFTNPAPGRPITSTFGNRSDPFLGKLAMHTGIDFRFETGEPVRATGSGKVTTAGSAGGYGNMVEIDHGNGITTRYGHLSKISVAVGDKVAVGDMIGRAGSTGRSTGPHLHYEVRYMGEAENPMRFLKAAAKLETLIR